jgi:GNAT superfamily N-acetyltransferase
VTNPNPFDGLIWNALSTEHARFAIAHRGARRYPAEVAPFVALADESAGTFAQLEELLAPGERVYIIGTRPQATETLAVGDSLRTFQMLGPSRTPSVGRGNEFNPVRLDAADARAMVALTDTAFPGFFRPRTHEMGHYFGIRVAGELVAMAGERVAIPGYREISAVCTHPSHTGKGYGSALTNLLLRFHSDAGIKSFLHVAESNTHAFALYQRLGFTIAASAELWPISLRA